MAKTIQPPRSNVFKGATNDDETLTVDLPLLQEDPPKKKKEKKERTRRESKPPKQKKERSEQEIAAQERRFRVFGLFCLLMSFYFLFSFASYLLTWQNDFSYTDTVFKHFTLQGFFGQKVPVENWMGKIGALTGYLFISKWFGVASFLFVVILFNTGMKHFFHIRIFPVWKTLEYSFFGIIWLPVCLSLTVPGNDLLSGVYGYQVNLWLTEFLGASGLAMLLGFTGFSLLILSFNIPFRWFAGGKKKGIPVEDTTPPVMETQDGASVLPAGDEPASMPFNLMKEPVVEPETGKEIDLEMSPEPEPAESAPSGLELQIEQPAKEEPVAPNDHQSIETLYDPKLDLSSYKYPPLELLNEYGGDSTNVNKEELEANKDKIVSTLLNYDIRISKIKATIGPAVTLYEIVPEAGVRISRIKNLEDDIALSLAAMGIRIIAPIPGKGTIGIEVLNQNPEIVSIRSLLGTEKFRNSTFELPFVLGKTISNETFIADLARMPHLLMAGATGQGKSVGLNTIITSLLYKKHPSQVKFVLIDPKKVELTLYNKIERHFLAKLPDSEEAIITDTKKVIRTLNSLNIEMDSRYDLLRDAQVRNIKEYNEKFFTRKLNPNEGHQFLPYIVLVIDEFADLIMTAGREIETPLTRLAQLARATGIHLVIATQRPSVNIITGTIKANFPARIAFRVISKIDSRTILDSSGADQLIGRGDMLLSTGSDLIRIQCAFVDTPEIEKLTEFIGSQRGYPEAFPLPEYYDEESGSSPKEFDPNEKDEFFGEAARLVVQHQHGSTSLIQRKLKLGYNRAGRIIDQLEGAGIVGPFEGSKAREVRYKDLDSLEEYLSILGQK
ncbi:MAG TPA: DNA translocase FtsK 4TM domain-containing protein [Bacteroidales bacterium]|nr:DNA translocase FtsK 4TM domain-containing protein [Bacteroidales bacterium]